MYYFWIINTNKYVFTCSSSSSNNNIGWKVITETTSVLVPIPGAHGITFVLARIF